MSFRYLCSFPPSQAYPGATQKHPFKKVAAATCSRTLSEEVRVLRSALPLSSRCSSAASRTIGHRRLEHLRLVPLAGGGMRARLCLRHGLDEHI